MSTLSDMLSDPSQITVEVLNPEAPFGGVLVQQGTERPLQVEINTGSPVQSVFGRVGNIVAKCSDYASCYAPLAANEAIGEVPGGVVNGVNTNFTTVNPFTKLSVYANGIRMKQGSDYIVTGSNSFQFLYPPMTGWTLLVDYQ